MGAGIKIPIHQAIVFNLDSASADRFLEQHSSGVFFILYCQAGTNKNLRKLSEVIKKVKTFVTTNYTLIR